MTLRVSLFLLILAISAACSGPAAACDLLDQQVNTGADSSQALTDCLRRLAPGQRLELLPGVYSIDQPVTIDRPVTIETAGLAVEAPSCAELGPGRCATLHLAPDIRRAKPKQMPIEIRSDDVQLSHLILEGNGQAARQRGYCTVQVMRPLTGVIRVAPINALNKK